jgi:hypothetical protein
MSLVSIADRHYNDSLSKKPPPYLREYERIFEPMRHAPLKLLELGVQDGFSMYLWKEYLPNAVVVGLDCDPRPVGFPDDPRFYFVQGGQDDPVCLQAARAAVGGEPFDIIIDDASHRGSPTGRSFALLFPEALKPGGVYVIEDICTAYQLRDPNDDAQHYAPAEIGLPGYQKAFPSHDHGMVGLVKQLFDHAMAPTAAGGYTRYPIKRMIVISNFVVLEKA